MIQKRSVLYFTLVAIGYTAGVISFSQQLWPMNVITAHRNAAVAKALSSNFDELGAFSNLAKKVEVPCPIQNDSTSVLLVLGQSNSANHGEKKSVSKYPTKVLNYYMGKCYSAESPLLGASGMEGEYLTLVGDELIKKGNLSNIILVNKSIGGSTISDWASGGELNSDLVATLNQLNLNYHVTHVVWHQGESDFASKTTFRKYYDSFQEIKLTLSQNNVNAPIFLVISTICGYDSTWIAQNPVAIAQKSLINKQDTFLGMDADSSLVAADRRAQSPSQEPNCHLSEIGQDKVARLISNKILEFNNFQGSR